MTGVPTADEFWQHTDYSSHTGGGLTELARGTNLGSTGWVLGTEYEFEFVFLPGSLQVFVDGVLELDVTGTFADGRMGFYNFSQAGVTYSAFTQEEATAPIPEPTTLIIWSLLATLGLSFYRRRRRRAF